MLGNRIEVRISERTKENLIDASNKSGRTISQLVREAVEAFYDYEVKEVNKNEIIERTT